MYLSIIGLWVRGKPRQVGIQALQVQSSAIRVFHRPNGFNVMNLRYTVNIIRTHSPDKGTLLPKQAYVDK